MKGQIGMEAVPVIVTVFVFAVAIFVLYEPLQSMNDSVQNDSDLSQEAKQVSKTVSDGYASWMDAAFITLIALLVAASVIMAYFSTTHPALLIAVLLILIAMITVLSSFEALVESLFGVTGTIDYSNVFPMTYYVVTNTTLFALGTAVLVFGVMFAS